MILVSAGSIVAESVMEFPRWTGVAEIGARVMVGTVTTRVLLEDR